MSEVTKAASTYEPQDEAEALRWWTDWRGRDGEKLALKCAFARHRTTALAALEAENAELRAEVERLREALEGLVTDPEDDPCWYDHHGYCQAHCLNDPCEMAIARAALGSDRNG